MKKSLYIYFIFYCIQIYSQSPEKFTYQSIVRGSDGAVLTSAVIGFRLTILQNSSTGSSVYSETHTGDTNQNGLVTLIIGDGTSSDNFSSIDWSTGQYFLKVEVDPLGGSNYLIEDTSQLLSVPYALYSGNSLKLTGKDYITLNNQELTIGQVDLVDDVDGILPVINGGTGSNTALMVGVITANDPASARAVLGLGTVATTASGDYATAAQGVTADAALPAANVSIFGSTLIDDADAATARTTLGLGTVATTASGDYATAAQGVTADAALPAANVSIFGSTLIDDADAATARTTLGLGTVATTASGDYATAAQGVTADAALPAANVSIFGSTLIDDVDAATARTTLGLGTVATTASGDYATAAQGVTADAALPAANVSIFGSTLIDDADAATARTTLGLGTVATTASGDYATAAQGVTADAALPAANVSIFGSTLIDDADAATARTTLGLGTVATTASGDYATAAQGVTADAALPAANVSIFGSTLIDDVDAATARTTLGLGTAAATDVLTFGIDDTNSLKVDQTGGAADDDFAKFTANGIEGRSATELKSDLGLVIGTNVLAQQTIGIADDNLLEVDDSDAADDDFAKFTANGIEGRSATELKSDLGLVIGTNVLAQQTIGIADDNLLEVDDSDAADDDFAKFTANGIEGRSATELKSDLGLVIGTNVLAQQTIGIADDNLLEVDDSDAADDDFAKFTANGIEGRSATELKSDLGLVIGTNVLAQQTIGIADDNLLEVDDSDAADDDFAKFTANGIEGRSATELKSDLGLVIGTNVLAQQTIGIADDNLLEVDDSDAADDDFAKFTANGIEGRSATELKSDLGLVIGTNVLAQQTIGIADDNLLEVDDSDAADDDFAKFTANGIEGRSATELKSDLGLVIGTNVLAQQTIGIADDNLLEVDDSDAADDDFAKFTANGIEGRSATELKSDLGLVIGTNVLAQQTIGIADDNLLEVDDSDAADDDFAKFTANGIEGRSATELKSDLGVDASGVIALQSGDVTGNIMTKIVQITTSSSANSSTTEAHGLTLSKIVGFQAMLNNSDGVLVNENSQGSGANSTYGLNYFGVSIGSSNIAVTTSAATSGNKTLSQTCTVLIIYLE